MTYVLGPYSCTLGQNSMFSILADFYIVKLQWALSDTRGGSGTNLVVTFIYLGKV